MGTPALPSLSADVVLLHAPAVFEFRDRSDVYFPFLGTSGDVPITPLYEYFPIGFKTLERRLGEAGLSCRIVNLSTLFLKYPRLGFDAVARALDAKLVGIDLHWMVHVQGSLAVAEALKRARPDLPIVFGGISSTYYARELIDYPFVDFVMRGYDTHEPLEKLVRALRREAGAPSITEVPNLVWKTPDGEPRENDFSHKPDTFGCGVDWSDLARSEPTRTLPILELLSTQNAGCAYDCGWCGGSREAFRRVFGKQRAMARKPATEIEYEFSTLARVEGLDRYHFYAVGSYNETAAGFDRFLDLVGGAGVKSISYEQFRLTSDDVLKRMAAANTETTITLSPESHDPRVAKLAGRGVYSNEEMEAWIDRALGFGIRRVDIWYFVGMPEQDARSVDETVAYCEKLLARFRGRGVNPMICPMIPFLDPASTFFERPEEHGYRRFFRSVEEHRRGMERASIVNRINYETRWLSRADLVRVGFGAVRELMNAKAAHGAMPRRWVADYVAKIDDALRFIPVVHEIDDIPEAAARARALEGVGGDIRARNQALLFGGVANQAFPLARDIGGRWFDEFGWTREDLEKGMES